MEKDLDHQKELQLLPPPPPPPPPPAPSSSRALPWLNHHHHHHHHRRRSSKPPLYPFESHEVDPSLDLQLRISHDEPSSNYSCVDALKWQAAEHIRLAAIENAYAERVRELTRLEIELAQSEFARARAMWDKAREEVAKAERLRDSATTCMGEITCYSCRQSLRNIELGLRE